jgi:predicted XRE-type DNA-binding protein
MIYFLRHTETGLIKIGKTIGFSVRLSQLMAQHGDLELIGLMPGYTEEERELHEYFHNCNERDILAGREWFKPDTHLVKYINKHSSLTFPLPFGVEHVKRIVDIPKVERPFVVENRLTQAIEMLMENHSLNQKQMAERLGINSSVFSIMLRMRPSKLVNVDILDKLYQNFGITPNDVLLHTDKKQRNS